MGIIRMLEENYKEISVLGKEVYFLINNLCIVRAKIVGWGFLIRIFWGMYVVRIIVIGCYDNDVC